MRIRTTLDAVDLDVIARDVGVSIANMGTPQWRPRLGVTEYRLRFVPSREYPERYRRVSAPVFSGERKVHALCWHGFLDVFRAIFAADPSARITTAFADWRSLADLEARKAEAFNREVGAPVYPVTFGELCRCERAGRLD